VAGWFASINISTVSTICCSVSIVPSVSACWYQARRLSQKFSTCTMTALAGCLTLENTQMRVP